jgi:putative flippase GtrA
MAKVVAIVATGVVSFVVQSGWVFVRRRAGEEVAASS